MPEPAHGALRSVRLDHTGPKLRLVEPQPGEPGCIRALIIVRLMRQESEALIYGHFDEALVRDIAHDIDGEDGHEDARRDAPKENEGYACRSGSAELAVVARVRISGPVCVAQPVRGFEIAVGRVGLTQDRQGGLTRASNGVNAVGPG